MWFCFPLPFFYHIIWQIGSSKMCALVFQGWQENWHGQFEVRKPLRWHCICVARQNCGLLFLLSHSCDTIYRPRSYSGKFSLKLTSIVADRQTGSSPSWYSWDWNWLGKRRGKNSRQQTNTKSQNKSEVTQESAGLGLGTSKFAYRHY